MKLLQGIRSTPVVGALVLASVACLAGCGGEEAAGEQRGQPPALVRVGQLQQKTLSKKIVLVGNVTPVRTSIVASGANGIVQYLREADPDSENNETTSPGDPIRSEIEVGQFVKKGRVFSVLRMDATNNELKEARSLLEERRLKFKAVEENHPKELLHAEAMRKMAEAVKTNAEQKWQRTKSLFDRGVANETELEDALEKWKAAQQSYIAAEQRWSQVKSGRDVEQAQAALDAQQAHVDYLESEKAKRTTKAPFDGHIVNVHTYVGQWLSKGDPVVTLAKMDEVDVVVHVDQADLSLVRLGQTAHLKIDGAPEIDWEGRVAQIVPQSDWDSGSRGFPVVVRIKNELPSGSSAVTADDEPPLKAGMLAHVTIEGPPVETKLVPKNALVRTTEGFRLFVFTPQEPGAKFDPVKPTAGSVMRFDVEPNLSMSEGNMIGISLKDPQAGSDPLQPGVWVVTEGGERFPGPVQDGVNALSAVESSSAGQNEQSSNKPADAPSK